MTASVTGLASELATGPEPLWPAAVSERAVALVHGPARRATVLGTFPTALYLQVGSHARVLPIVTPGGLRLPTALAVATPLPTVGWGVQPGDHVVVGGGDVLLPYVTIRAVRRWRPHPVHSAAVHQGRVGARLSSLRLGWRTPARSLTETLAKGDRDALPDRVHALVGTGPGLTPSGDDVLCGVLLGLRLHPRGSDSLVDRLWHAVLPRLSSTTSLSAALLTEAAEGYAVVPVVRLTEALAGFDPTDPAASGEVDLAVRAVLAIGHSSGADLLGGLAGCLDALDALDALHALGALFPLDRVDHTGPLAQPPGPAMTHRSLQ